MTNNNEKEDALDPKKIVLEVFIILVLIIIFLSIGMFGYKHFAKFSWVDSFTNASMLLSGMGPMNPIGTTEGKIFASIFALFSGILFMAGIGYLISKIL